MILDGYTEWAALSEGHIAYRPFTRQDRAVIGPMLAAMPEGLAYRTLQQLVLGRVVEAEFPVDPDEMNDADCERLVQLTLGIGSDQQEQADEKNLADGAYLASVAPHLLRVSCEQCRTWWYDPTTGKTAQQNGEPLLRIAGTPLACDMGACPKGHWKSPVELSAKNAAALRYDATCPQTDDPIVNRNRRIIADAAQRAERDQAATRQRGGGSGRPGSDRNAGRKPYRRGAGRIAVTRDGRVTRTGDARAGAG